VRRTRAAAIDLTMLAATNAILYNVRVKNASGMSGTLLFQQTYFSRGITNFSLILAPTPRSLPN